MKLKNLLKTLEVGDVVEIEEFGGFRHTKGVIIQDYGIKPNCAVNGKAVLLLDENTPLHLQMAHGLLNDEAKKIGRFREAKR